MKLLYEELTYQIRSSIFEVRKEIGAGFDEETYHQCLLLSFHRQEFPFISKESRALMHRGELIRNFVNDFVLFDKIILSVKCIPCKFLQTHYVQLFSELKLWKKKLGLIVNFGLPDVDIERYVFDEKEPVFIENYESIRNQTSQQEKEIIDQLRKAIQSVAVEHKPGYGKVVWRKIMEAELNALGIPFSKNNLIPVRFFGRTVRTYRLRHLIVNNRILLAINALQKGIEQFDIANMQSYLKALNLSVGVIVNFGKAQVHISGVRAPRREN